MPIGAIGQNAYYTKSRSAGTSLMSIALSESIFTCFRFFFAYAKLITITYIAFLVIS